MKHLTLPLFILCVSNSYAASLISFEFDTSSNAINGDTSLADLHDTAIDGVITPTAFSLDSIVSGLLLTVTSSQSHISYTANGLGITSGGTLNTAGDALTFSFNQAITLDFLDMGDFTGNGLTSEDAVSIIYSNSNPTVTLIGGSFDNNTSDTITFSSGNALTANESFTINRVDGNFSLEGFNVTVVPEPSSTVLLGIGGLALILRRRK